MFQESTGSLREASNLPDWLAASIEPLAQHLFQGDRQHETIVASAFESRYFSSLLDISLQNRAGVIRRYLLKYPKRERRRGYKAPPPVQEEDRVIAQMEWDAFCHLAAQWHGQRARVVKPLFFDRQLCVIGFDYLPGEDYWSRPFVRRAVWGRGADALSEHLLAGLGGDLARYHMNVGVQTAFNATTDIAKVRRRERGLGLPEATLHCPTESALMVQGVKGLDIRNARISAGELWLFDPGHIKYEPAEADVARVLVSVLMLAWGTPFFGFRARYRALEAAFLGGYSAIRKIDSELLALYSRREAAKNWAASREAILQKRAPAWALQLMSRQYVDRGFQRLWTELTLGISS